MRLLFLSTCCAVALTACGGQTFDVGPSPDEDGGSDASMLDTTTNDTTNDTTTNDVIVADTKTDTTTSDTATNDAERDSSLDTSGDTAPHDASSDAADGRVDASDAKVSGCPPTMPPAGTACSPVDLVCAYGDDPRPTCRQSVTCTTSGWSSPPTKPCPPPPTDTCPASADLARGAACTTVGAFCFYGDVTCGCGNCFGGPCGGASKWVCNAPPADPSCPRLMPNLGTTCTSAGLSCQYGSCSTNTEAGRRCASGVWTDVPVPCPL